MFDDSASDPDLTSEPSLPTESDIESDTESDKEDDFVHRRLLHSVEYFQELDDLASKVFQNSVFHFYIVSSKGRHLSNKITK